MSSSSHPHPERDPDQDALRAAVRARRARQARREREGEGSLARDLALVGVLGWTIVGPMLLGLFGGRWLDHRLGSGIFWTGALLVLGLAIGCVLGWRRVRGS